MAVVPLFRLACTGWPRRRASSTTGARRSRTSRKAQGPERKLRCTRTPLPRKKASAQRRRLSISGVVRR